MVSVINPVESFIVQPAYFQLVHDSEVSEILVHNLPFIQASHIMNAGIQQMPFSLIGLKTSAELFVFLEHTDIVSLFAKDGTAL